MSNLGPRDMRGFLRDTAKEQSRQARGQGALLRPKPGIPAVPNGETVTLDATGLNELHRYGARLVVWNFAYTLAAADLLLPAKVARVPVDFYPEFPVRFAGWANGVGAALLQIDVDGWMSVQPGTATNISGSVAYTSAV